MPVDLVKCQAALGSHDPVQVRLRHLRNVADDVGDRGAADVDRNRPRTTLPFSGGSADLAIHSTASWKDGRTVDSCFSLALTAAALAAMTATGCALAGQHNVVGKSIRYQVEYQGSPLDRMSHSALSVTYTTNDGLQEQTGIQLPWTEVTGTAGPRLRPSVKAQFDGYGSITCRIFADNKLIVERKSPPEIPYPAVECTA